MKANEFVKKHGIKKTSSELSLFQSILAGHFGWAFVEELKRLVESHELVQSKGGLKKAKEYLNKKPILTWNALDGQLSQAVKDVEACQ